MLFEVLETWPTLVAIDHISSNAKHQSGVLKLASDSRKKQLNIIYIVYVLYTQRTHSAIQVSVRVDAHKRFKKLCQS